MKIERKIMLEKNVSKILTFCLGLIVMTLYAESSCDFYAPTLGKRTRSQSDATIQFDESSHAFSKLDELINEFVCDQEKKDNKRRRDIAARREYLNKVDSYYIYRNNNANIIQKEPSTEQYRNGLILPDQRAFDEKTTGDFPSIPSSIFQGMLIQVFSFMNENNYCDKNFKDPSGRHYLYYLG